jgi:hypothetical protein
VALAPGISKEVAMKEATGTSRRGLLGRGALLAVGALGLTAAGAQGTAWARTAKRGGQLRIYGRNFHLHSPEHRAGTVPEKGDRHSTYGELLDRPNGKVIGHFSAAHLTQDSPFAAATSSLEIHTFTLTGGTIHGLGSVERGAEGHFVIVGGTGRFEGARGNYAARLRSRELGGNGAAEFRMTLLGQEVANGI